MDVLLTQATYLIELCFLYFERVLQLILVGKKVRIDYVLEGSTVDEDLGLDISRGEDESTF